MKYLSRLSLLMLFTLIGFHNGLVSQNCATTEFSFTTDQATTDFEINLTNCVIGASGSSDGFFIVDDIDLTNDDPTLQGNPKT